MVDSDEAKSPVAAPPPAVRGRLVGHDFGPANALGAMQCGRCELTLDKAIDLVVAGEDGICAGWASVRLAGGMTAAELSREIDEATGRTPAEA